MSKYDKMTDEDFQRCLVEVIESDKLSVKQWLAIPGIYEIMPEEYNMVCRSY